MGKFLPCAGFGKQLVRVFQDVLISALGADGVRIGSAVGKAVGFGFALLREPEADGIGGGLPRLVVGEAGGTVVGVAVHEDGVQPREGTGRKDGGGGCRRIGVAMGVIRRVFHAVDNLAGLLDPMPRRVQVFPCAVFVILQIVKGAVGLAFDGDGALCRKGRAGY